MRKFFLSALLAVCSLAAHATDVFFEAGSRTGTSFTQTVYFTATPPYTTYAISINSGLEPVYNSSGAEFNFTVIGTPVLKDANGNIVTDAWVHTATQIMGCAGYCLDLDSWNTNGLSLINGMTYSITFSGTGFWNTATGGSGLIPLFVNLTAN